jgi:hypothetical protein
MYDGYRLLDSTGVELGKLVLISRVGFGLICFVPELEGLEDTNCGSLCSVGLVLLDTGAKVGVELATVGPTEGLGLLRIDGFTVLFLNDG